MTTNKPDELDEALVRSGRISVRVGFQKTKLDQSKDIFLRMFAKKQKSGTDNAQVGDGNKPTATPRLALSEAHLQDLAKTFAASLPENEFSPADLQDYLLTHKEDPQRAVDQVEAWKTKELAERAKRAAEKEEDRQERMRQKEERKKRMAAKFSDLVNGGRREKGNQTQKQRQAQEAGRDNGCGQG